jgi:alkylhydroperoxidase family enzyme
MSSHLRVAVPREQTGNSIRDSALGLVPETVEPLIALNERVWNGGAVRPALLELVRLRNARLVNCVFCRSVRYDVARADGLTEDKVAGITDGYEQSSLDEREKRALVFADAYLKSGGELDPTRAAEVRAAFTPEELAHLAIALVSFNAASRCAVSLGGMPEDLPVMEILLSQTTC